MTMEDLTSLEISNLEKLELFKAGINALLAILTLSLGWFFGQRFTHNWTILQKKRELELATVNDLYKLYGEFFAVLKLWNYNKSIYKNNNRSKEMHWKLLKRATAAEAGIEAVVFKVASERDLAEKEVAWLGKFRQAYQQLRKSIKLNNVLNWNRSEHPEYVAFKTGAIKLALMINFGEQKYNWFEKFIFPKVSKIPDVDKAIKALLNITSNEWENNWRNP